MLNDGIIIMAVGMLVVFLFLSIMVFSMRAMSGIILKHFPEPDPPASFKRSSSGSNDAELAVAIAMAWMKC